MFACQLLRHRIRPMTFQAKCIPLSSQQMLILPSVRCMTCGAALDECGLVVHGFLGEIGDVAVATQANLNSGGLRKSRFGAGVRVMAVGAIAGCAGMLHF